MGRLCGLGWLVLLVAIISTEAQQKRLTNISTKCLGNLMRVDVGPLRGRLLEVAVVANGFTIPLSPGLASQCGFRVKMQQLGSAVIYASLHNCFAQNVEDDSFSTTLQLRLQGNGEDEVLEVEETCSSGPAASREILCDRNYMEVSVKNAIPDDYVLSQQPVLPDLTKVGDPRRAAEKRPMDAGFKITTLVFFTPEERAMTVLEAQKLGYGISNSPSRLLLRSPASAPQSYTQNVAGVLMTVLKTSTIFEKKWLATQIDATAACPVPEGSVAFTPDAITWFLPWHIAPLVSSGELRLLEVHVGVDGERLDAAELAARRYLLTVNNTHVVLEIPVGAAGGYFKSYVRDGQYFTAYSIELMLELLWTEDDEDTRYKVLLPVTTPLQPRPLQLVDDTVPEERMFKVLLGSLASDVALMNVTLGGELLTVTALNVRGGHVEEHLSPDGSSKILALRVPFADRAVLQSREAGITVYSLSITVGLLVLPQYTPFSHTAYLEARVVDVVPPSISGSCGYHNFYVMVQYGSEGFDFQTWVGGSVLTESLAQQYGMMDNGTHLGLAVPFSSPEVAFEAIEESALRNRLDVTLRNPETNKHLQQFSLSCSFPSTLTECFPNGTMTAFAVKLEAVPSLNLAALTLRDPACGPTYSDQRYAYFVFTTSSCGTTRKFSSNFMLYENEIALPDEIEKAESKQAAESDVEEPEYELKVSCYYDIKSTRAVAFHTRARRSEPFAENAKGELQVEMRLASDDSYSVFHQAEDYPLAKYLQQPLYFEVELTRSTNPNVKLELESCWATLNSDRTSQPRWNLIINGCANPVDPYEVIFHPVWPDDRVQYPSHFKRFEVQMFAFAEDKDMLYRQLFIHCDVVICDPQNPLSNVCNGQCSNRESGMKVKRRAVSEVQTFKHVSSGLILIL